MVTFPYTPYTRVERVSEYLDHRGMSKSEFVRRLEADPYLGIAGVMRDMMQERSEQNELKKRRGPGVVADGGPSPAGDNSGAGA